MTIDERVAQRYEPRMVGFCDRPPEAGMSVSLHGHYVLQSAYAEMAAERDSLRSAGLYTANRLAEAEAQLAELREKVVGLAEHYDWLFQTEQDDEMSGRHIANELRTLAAADGTTTGEMK